MNCSEIRNLLHAYIDGELDLVHQVEIEQHLHDCAECSKFYESQLALRSSLKTEDLRFQAPARLRRMVESSMPRTSGTPYWIGLAAAAAIAVVVVTAIMSLRPGRNSVVHEVVSAHIRSLMPGHLTDVMSTDQHTVKPWFNGKLDYSPPVTDFRSEGFPLIGGRLDYIDNRPVAALVYSRGKHVISLFVWPENSEKRETFDSRQGFNVISWSENLSSFCAVSDLNGAELRQFAALIRRGTPPR